MDVMWGENVIYFEKAKAKGKGKAMHLQLERTNRNKTRLDVTDLMWKTTSEMKRKRITDLFWKDRRSKTNVKRGFQIGSKVVISTKINRPNENKLT